MKCLIKYIGATAIAFLSMNAQAGFGSLGGSCSPTIEESFRVVGEPDSPPFVTYLSGECLDLNSVSGINGTIEPVVRAWVDGGWLSLTPANLNDFIKNSYSLDANNILKSVYLCRDEGGFTSEGETKLEITRPYLWYNHLTRKDIAKSVTEKEEIFVRIGICKVL